MELLEQDAADGSEGLLEYDSEDELYDEEELPAPAQHIVTAVRRVYTHAEGIAAELTPQQAATLIILCVLAVATYLFSMLMRSMPAGDAQTATLAPVAWTTVGYLVATSLARSGRPPRGPAVAAGGAAGAAAVPRLGGGAAAGRPSPALASAKPLGTSTPGGSSARARRTADRGFRGVASPASLSRRGSGGPVAIRHIHAHGAAAVQAARALAQPAPAAEASVPSRPAAPRSARTSSSAAEQPSEAGASVLASPPRVQRLGADDVTEASVAHAESAPSASTPLAVPNEPAATAAAETVPAAEATADATGNAPEQGAAAMAAPDREPNTAEQVPPGHVTQAVANTINTYIRAVDACDKAHRYDEADKLLTAAAAALSKDAAPPALDASLPSEPDFSSDAARETYARDYPTLPAVKTRLSAALLWRRARNCMKQGSWLLANNMAASASKAERVRQIFEIGLQAAKDSLALYEEDADAHKFAGILSARAAKDMKEKIANAYKIRDHTQRAIQIRPNDPVLHHILGVWCYEVSSLGWVARQVASALFGKPPSSTYDEALVSLLRSEELALGPTGSGPMMGTRLKIAQTYQAMGKKTEAKEWIQRCMEVPFAVGEDEDDIKASRELAGKLGVAVPA